MSETTGKMIPEPARRTTTKLPESADFHALLDFMALASETSARLQSLQGEIDEAYMDLVDEHRAEFSTLKLALSKAEQEMENLCRANPAWFAAVKSLKSPYGKVAFRQGTSLVVRDEEATVRLIDAIRPGDKLTLVRTHRVPDLEALEKLTDEELAAVCVKRQSADVFKFTAATVEMGTAPKPKPENN